MSIINLDELYKIKQDKLKKKADIYNSVLKKVHQRIKNVAINSYECFCFFAVEDFIFGIPSYNKNECIKYLFNKLVSNGFKVRYTHPNLFYISWNHYVKKENKQIQSNINTTPIKKEINSYKPSGTFIYGDQLNRFKYKTKSLLDN